MRRAPHPGHFSLHHAVEEVAVVAEVAINAIKVEAEAMQASPAVGVAIASPLVPGVEFQATANKTTERKRPASRDGRLSKRQTCQSFELGHYVLLGDESGLLIAGTGDVPLRLADGSVKTLRQVLHVPQMTKNLVSVRQIFISWIVSRQEI